MEGCCRCISYHKSEIFTHDCPQFIGKYVIMKVIPFHDSSTQAYRLGKALLTYTNFVL